MAKISIVTSENASGWEWRTEPAEAEAAFRAMRGLKGVTKLWHGVEVGEMPGGNIDEYVDGIYWDGDQEATWGKPARVHGLAR